MKDAPAGATVRPAVLLRAQRGCQCPGSCRCEHRRTGRESMGRPGVALIARLDAHAACYTAPCPTLRPRDSALKVTL